MREVGASGAANPLDRLLKTNGRGPNEQFQKPRVPKQHLKQSKQLAPWTLSDEGVDAFEASNHSQQYR